MSEDVVPQADRQGHAEIAAQQGQSKVTPTVVSESPAFVGTLTAADKKVMGASVYNLANENLGTIDDLMIDLSSGRVHYAVMSFGGFLGLGAQSYPVPWELLRYDATKEAFVVDLDKTRLENAPNYGLDFEWTRRYASEVDRHYDINRAPPSTTTV